MSAMEIPYRTTVSARAEMAGKLTLMARTKAARSIELRVRMNQTPLNRCWGATSKLDARLGTCLFSCGGPTKSCNGNHNQANGCCCWHSHCMICIRNSHPKIERDRSRCVPIFLQEAGP